MTRRFRSKAECEICGEDAGIFKPKCYDPEDVGEVERICKKCHAEFCCQCKMKPFRVLYG